MHPTLKLKPKTERRVLEGSPWVYSNEIEWQSSYRDFEKGGLINLETANGKALGTFMFNPNSLIAARFLNANANALLDESYFENVLRRALHLREKFFAKPFYRLIHAEADGIPGVIIDRYGDVAVVSVGTAGIDLVQDKLLSALERVIAPRVIWLNNEQGAREIEGLALESRLYKGDLAGPLTIEENDCRYVIDIKGGQKTGWFFDQRLNRAMVAPLAKGKSILDVYCYAGGFGLLALKEGAARATFIDRSEHSLSLMRQSAELNGLNGKYDIVEGEAFVKMAEFAAAGKKFDVVVTDPPAFAKAKKDVGPAKKGYRKAAELSAQLVAPEGFLFIASCSHHILPEVFYEQVAEGVTRAGRRGRLLRQVGAGYDHPVHLHLAQTAYLKGLLLQLD